MGVVTLVRTLLEIIMKLLKLFYLFGIAILVSACSMFFYGPDYFGTEYPPTDTVQIFYSAKDINEPFKVIGHMNATTGSSRASKDRTQELVIERAKKAGADAVIFSEIDRQRNSDSSDDLSVKVEVVKFEKGG